MQIRQELRQFVIDNFLFGREGDLKDDASFLENGIIDSTGVLELIAFLEERFGLELAETDLTPENLDSIDKVARLVESRLAAPKEVT
ncbi:MAG: acyl carrier protein [Terriglobia bacterium]|jgi:acyl carrier protein